MRALRLFGGKDGDSEEGDPVLFKRIVVGTDGSETAAAAVGQAIELAKAAGSSLDIVSAFEPVTTERLREEAQELPGDVAHATGPREDVNFTLDTAAGQARQEGLEVETHPREGDPADAILDVAEEKGADLIVVGNKGMTGAKRFLLGSVPNKISHHAPCGVYIVRTT
jgi:nucleotide-binding universal stress UspA family protein